MKLLTIVQEKLLVELEAIVEKNGPAFVQCGEALSEIREKKLYLKYGTFEEYCEIRWGWKRQYAYRIMKATSVRKSLEISKSMVPIWRQSITNEAQLRELETVATDKRALVFKTAAKTGSVTAKSIAAAAKTVLTQKPEEVLDEMGYPVPAPAMAYWLRRGEAQRYVNLISAARCAVRDLIVEQEAKNDRLYVNVNLQEVLAALSDAYTGMKQAVPYAVCGKCQGQVIKQCTACGHLGVVGKFRWNNTTEIAVKEMRKKLCRK